MVSVFVVLIFIVATEHASENPQELAGDQQSLFRIFSRLPKNLQQGKDLVHCASARMRAIQSIRW